MPYNFPPEVLRFIENLASENARRQRRTAYWQQPRPRVGPVEAPEGALAPPQPIFQGDIAGMPATIATDASSLHGKMKLFQDNTQDLDVTGRRSLRGNDWGVNLQYKKQF